MPAKRAGEPAFIGGKVHICNKRSQQPSFVQRQGQLVVIAITRMNYNSFRVGIDVAFHAVTVAASQRRLRYYLKPRCSACALPGKWRTAGMQLTWRRVDP